MKSDKCGIYEIRCTASGKSYVGSSYRIYQRWYEHRRGLRLGIHTSPRLQQAWTKHGEAAFAFSVLEECEREVLFEREQVHLDAEKRDYNSMPKVRVITKEMRAKMNAANAALGALVTHCPHGHEYTEANTYRSKRNGARICRACNRERVAKIYAAETPEQTAARLKRDNDNYHANREEKRAKANAYAARTREAKNAYDIAYRPIKNARRRAATAARRE